MKYVPRNIYLNQLIKYQELDLIKVISGIRRVGKSVVLKQLEEYFISENKEVFYLDLEAYSNKNYLDPDYFYSVLEGEFKDKSFTLIIDEVQKIKDWENFIPGIWNEFNVNLYIGGSTNNLLADNLKTTFGGRTISLHILPFSLNEYKLINDQKNFNSYLGEGGFPWFLMTNVNSQLLSSDFKKLIIENDIRAHNNDATRTRVDNIFLYFMEHMGKIQTINNIHKYLEANVTKINYKTVETIVEDLHGCFLIYKCPRIKLQGSFGKKILEGQAKYYLVDHIFTTFYPQVILKKEMVTENLVYIHLLRMGYQVYVGTVTKKDWEIDFVATKGKEVVYIQVTVNLEEEKTYERETRSLLAIKDNYPKYIITLDNISQVLPQGIKSLGLEYFLEKDSLKYD